MVKAFTRRMLTCEYTSPASARDSRTSASSLQENRSHSATSLPSSGVSPSDSHRETVCRDTPIASASCSWVIFFCLRRYCRFRPMLMSASVCVISFGLRMHSWYHGLPVMATIRGGIFGPALQPAA